MKMLVTDLDNTLYDWVTYFAKSFSTMVNELCKIIEVEEDKILDEFQRLHQEFNTIEQPFTILELPSVNQKYSTLSRVQLMEKLDKALYAFNCARKEHLRLYDYVDETFRTLHKRNFVIVAHTEATDINAYYRLKKLGIKKYFKRLYAKESTNYKGHPDPKRQHELAPEEDFIFRLPSADRKPNPRVLLDICNNENISPANTWYVGDSLTKDIAMANQAGISSIWAKYGTEYDKSLWEVLVRVTHWTDEDVARESDLKRMYNNVKPNYVIDDFKQILAILKTSSFNKTGAATTLS